MCERERGVKYDKEKATSLKQNNARYNHTFEEEEMKKIAKAKVMVVIQPGDLPQPSHTTTNCIKIMHIYCTRIVLTDTKFASNTNKNTHSATCTFTYAQNQPQLNDDLCIQAKIWNDPKIFISRYQPTDRLKLHHQMKI